MLYIADGSLSLKNQQLLFSHEQDSFLPALVFLYNQPIAKRLLNHKKLFSFRQYFILVQK